MARAYGEVAVKWKVDAREVEVRWDPFTVGRSSRAVDLRFDDASVSAVHAVVRWSGARWELRDVSTNGTYVDDQRIGRPTPLRVGTVVRFGLASEVHVLDLAPPEPCARADDGRRVGESGVLALPDADSPIATVVSDEEGVWWFERLRDRHVVEDGDTVTVGAETFILELPPPGPTIPVRDRALLDGTRLEIGVSRDEESVRVVAEGPWGRADFGIRAHHYLLVTLARLREEDAELPPAERGWVDSDRLLNMLRVSENLLYTYVFRCRKQLREHGLTDADRLIDRRAGQLRLGVSDVRVCPLEM